MAVCYTDFHSVEPTDKTMNTTRERIRTETGRAPRQIALGDTAYPANLREIQAPPERLYVRGALAEDDALAIAIVGSRAATSYGLAVAERLGADLAGARRHGGERTRPRHRQRRSPRRSPGRRPDDRGAGLGSGRDLPARESPARG